MSGPELRHDFVQGAGVRLHVAEIGAGEPVLLLHGFPELWYGFRRLAAGLAARGYRVLTPDLRGYGASDKPKGVRHYRVAALLEDLRAIIRTKGEGRAHVVGHDWGGTLAYCLASESPELVRRLSIMNAPHPERLRELLFTSPQLLRSWYLFAFQLPFVPELLLQQRAVVEALFRGSAARPEVFSRQQLLDYHAALRTPRAAKSAVNYYRASFRWPVRAPRVIRAPTLIVWGDRDPALDARLLDRLTRLVPDLNIQHVPDAGHFVHHERPLLVEQLIAEHLAM